MAKELVVANRPKVPMAFAMSTLAAMCDAIDNGAELDDALVAQFQEAKLDLVEAIDRRVAFFRYLQGQIAAAKAARDAWQDDYKRLQAIEEKFKEKTKELVEAHPDLPKEGTIGKLAVQANPPSVKLTFEDRKLTRHVIDFFGVDEKYIKTETTYTLNAKLVADDLKAGVELPWARLEQGTHIRFK